MTDEKITEKKIILAVDDTQSNLQIIQGVLGKEFELRLAKSGNMALMALDRVVPELILLDIEMPGMSGFDVMDTISRKPHLKEIPVIFVTSHASKEFVTEAQARGAKDYVVKPFDPDVLRNKVHKALGL